MFEELVVSTTVRRKHRTALFLAGTSFVYAVMIASAVALSVVASTPRLADNSIKPPPVIPLSVAWSRDKQRSRSGRTTSTTDIRRVMDFDRLSRLPADQRISIQSINPPRPGELMGEVNDSPGWGQGNNIGFTATVPGGGTAGTEYIPPPTTPTPRQVQPDKRPVPVPSKILQGRATERYSPDYPRLAQQIHLQGEVSVEIIVSPEGRVESARAISGHPMLVSCALEAARRWRFQPTLLNGVPVRVTGVITFVFRLHE